MTEATNEQWELVASLDDLPEGEAVPFTVQDQQVALYNVEGEVHATSNICTHGLAYLTEGYLDGCTIECPLHQGVFDIRTGKAMCAPLTQDLPVYPVKIVGRDVFVNLTQSA